MTSAQSGIPVTANLAEFVHASTYRDLPPAVVSITRQHLLDTIGCSLAAVHVDTSRLLSTYLLSEGGAEQTTANRYGSPSAGSTGRIHERAARADPRI